MIAIVGKSCIIVAILFINQFKKDEEIIFIIITNTIHRFLF